MDISIGRIVHVRLHAQHAEAINRRRTTGGEIASRITADTWPLGAQAHIGNKVHEGDVFPMMVTRVWSPGTVNGQVFLDGSDVFWVTSATEGAENGQWSWPPRA